MRISVRYWRCAIPEYRFIMLTMVGAAGSLVPFIPRTEVDAALSLRGNPEELAEAMRENFAIEEFTVEPDHGPVFRAWYVNYEWVSELKNAYDGGCISLTDDFCQQLTFPAARDPDCTYQNW